MLSKRMMTGSVALYTAIQRNHRPLVGYGSKAKMAILPVSDR